MDFFKVINQLLRPKFAPYFALVSLLALLFLSTLLSGHYPPTPPPSTILSATIANSTTVPRRDVPTVIPQNVRLMPNPGRNQSSPIKDVVTLLKSYGGSESNGSVREAAGVVGRRRYGGGGDGSCDLFDGRWVVDRSGPSYRPGSCPFVDSAFDCYKNGRSDLGYTKLRWQPNGCSIPRFNGRGMLEILRGRRLAFVGDSLNRNMWQSLVCMLRSSVRNKRVYEISGRHEFRTEGSYSIKFADYNCTVEFFRTPFLVQEWQSSDSNGTSRETLRLDVVHKSSEMYKDADIIIFNTAHWWTHEKTSLGKDFYQEGEHVYSQLSAIDAYRKALTTWGKWIDANINRNLTRVFFRGYSSSHFRGGQWNSGGNCDGETLPIRNETQLTKYPKLMSIFETVIGQMTTPVHYLNITKMTDYRKDGHPSVYRQPPAERQPGAFQDCSHWCLPGVPDAWNEILYGMLQQNAKNATSRRQTGRLGKELVQRT